MVSSITLKASAEAVGGEASVVFATAEKLLANGALLQAATELTLPLPPTLNVLTPTLK